MSLDAAIDNAVTAATEKALAAHLRRLSDPEPLVYSVPEAAHVLPTSTNTVRRRDRSARAILFAGGVVSGAGCSTCWCSPPAQEEPP